MKTDFDVSRFVKSHDKITGIFGYWPSFHDAEVYELTLLRGDAAKRVAASTVPPELVVKIHLFEMTKDLDELGQFIFQKFTLVTLKFLHISDMNLTGFNHQNAIYELSLETAERGHYTNGEPMTPYIVVRFKAGFGLDASFKCLGVEVVDAVPATADRP